ncbi:Sterol 3-beta-glucosyltransferase [Lobosporangium transversale]|uniref:sterol 3beta-glucosyltransferase n=1 Tax=Lobosporangium transversale TaxID=64571 RepID=A0A1Y2GS45_9FUNG|nr:hypothetical protein BCR41DRAFT_352171 [Lobosporangium transversale]KAF9901840.1 Sterol 3-beta-glucosyltransferase [Lobosporangium transversale]ORZ18305.1 hypothetical protein BCR41DRAFT_352171 [Lobosporangium transversale]|eukprot:XP_021882100.1 hypothetical protein BCR41DRAFT_352171 [Lobosporangium transversale]
MSAGNRFMRPLTSGSAFLQFAAAALRQENMADSQQRSELSSEEEDDMVHVNKSGNDLHKIKHRHGSVHDLGIHSDGEEEGFSDEEGRYFQMNKQHKDILHPETQRSSSDGDDTMKIINAASFGASRDKITMVEKLLVAFGLPETEQVIGEYPCYLARSLLLPGHLYLTTEHILFYANLPDSQDATQKEGFFSKKSRTTMQFTRHWFVLKNDVLSYYANQSDVYFPLNTIDLKHALHAESSPNNDLTFHIFTENRKHTFKTDSGLSRQDWVKAIQKSILHATMEGNKVKISIPLSIVLGVEMNNMNFAEAIQVRVLENEESLAIEEYHFAYFDDAVMALETMKAQHEKCQRSKTYGSAKDNKIYDSTSPTIGATKRFAQTASTSSQQSSLFQGRRISRNFLYPPNNKSRSRSNSPSRSQPSSDTEENEKEKSRLAFPFSLRGTTNWLTDHKSGTDVSEENMILNDEEKEAFRREFSLPDSEELNTIVSGYLLRSMLVYGRIYVSENYVCFKSKFNVPTKTILIMPLADAREVDKQKGTQLFFHGLAILTKTDAEIFLEFKTPETRDKILNAIQQEISPAAQERRMKQRARAIAETPSLEIDDPIGSRVTDSLMLGDEPVHVEAMSWSSHPEFKARPPMRITCLTIGSRGDVQPYIALCKRLMKDGHKCRISTHGEYKDWIEGHGIEFGLVGGDPGELIELCVENGMFTVSFIREGLKRFRGWLDELMVSAWEACQGSDVLIESPSAMAGIHIAEKLDIPYFRAFPFPWTRTRAFPHPFAVPEHNLGRSYNYMTYVMIEQVFWKGISGQINRWRKETLGLGPTSLEKMDAHHVPSLYSWSPNVVPAPMDWPSWIHVTGYWFLDNPDLSWTPPEDLVAFLNAEPEKKPVYIGFGSMVVADPDGMTKAIIEAVVKSGVRAIISKGWSDRVTAQDGAAGAAKKAASEEIVYPTCIYMLKSVPHDWLFPQLAGCVHHGGAGTAAAGLRAGIPTVIKPFFGDQYFWAQRLEEAGVGVWCHDLTVKKLTSALITITTDEKMIRKAKLIGEKIRKEDGVGEAIKYFYHDLDLAKQRLNKRKEKSDDIPVSFRVEEAKDEEDWCVVQQSISSGANSAGEGSESTAGLNVLSGSEEDIISPPPESSTPQLAAFISGSNRRRSISGSNLEPLSHLPRSAASEPGPDRNTELLIHNNVTAEEMAARLEAAQGHSKSPVPFFSKAFGLSEGSQDKGKDKDKESKAAKRTSTARKVIESLTTKATHMTGYFNQSSGSSGAAPPSSLLVVGSSRLSLEQERGEAIYRSSSGSGSGPNSVTGGERPVSTKSHKSIA